MDNLLKQKLSSQQAVIGMWSVIPCATNIEILGLSGFDFAILDMEHGTYQPMQLENCIRAAEVAQMAPLVRIPANNHAAVQWALDLGAYGIVCPQITDLAHAEEAVKSTKFAPEGTRGFNPFTRFTNYNPNLPNGEGKLDNRFGLTTLIIETASAVAQIDAILNIQQLDVLYIGVYDLSFGLGYNGNTQHPELVGMVQNLIQKTLRAGKNAGLMVRNQAEINQALAQGVKFLVYSVDTHLIRQAAFGVIEQFNTAQQKQRQTV